MRVIFLTLCVVFLIGCSAKDPIVDDRPGIIIYGAHPRAIVYVNGISMGRAGQYGEKGRVLLLDPGNHYLEIVRRGAIVFTQRVFLGRGPQKIYVQ
jgi:hypothetical protein